MIYFVGIILSLFLSAILLGKKNKSNSNWILLIWLLVIALNLTLISLQSAENRFSYPSLLGWALPFPLLHWPFLYLYVSTLTSKRVTNFRLVWVHFIPFCLSILMFSGFLLLPNSSKINVYENSGKGYETQMFVNLIAIISSAIIYTALSLYRLRRFKSLIMHEFSYLEKINLNWLSYLIAGMTLIFFTVLFIGNDKAIYSLVVGFVFMIGYFGIRQVGIFSENILDPLLAENRNLTYLNNNFIKNHSEASLPNRKDEEVKNQKYLKSNLSEEEALRIHHDLNEIMKTEKLFRNAELKLDDLAKALDILPNHLSQVINSFENKNFYDYVNQLRINDFIELISLPENQKFTLLSLAFECGFNSKTSFNRNFKKVIGISPSDYLKKSNLKPTI